MQVHSHTRSVVELPRSVTKKKDMGRCAPDVGSIIESIIESSPTSARARSTAASATSSPNKYFPIGK
jgi:hypothetical protein